MFMPYPTESAEAFTDLVLEVFRLNGALLAAGDRLSAGVGLTSARWQVLGAIDAAPLTVADIARAMGLTRQSVQRTVDILAGEGVVEFRVNPFHQRAKLVALTPRGRRMLDEVTAGQRLWAAAVSEAIPAQDLRAASAVLAALRRRLEGGKARECAQPA